MSDHLRWYFCICRVSPILLLISALEMATFIPYNYIPTPPPYNSTACTKTTPKEPTTFELSSPALETPQPLAAKTTEGIKDNGARVRGMSEICWLEQPTNQRRLALSTPTITLKSATVFPRSRKHCLSGYIWSAIQLRTGAKST
jgi:hypothetical protein